MQRAQRLIAFDVGGVMAEENRYDLVAVPHAIRLCQDAGFELDSEAVIESRENCPRGYRGKRLVYALIQAGVPEEFAKRVSRDLYANDHPAYYAGLTPRPEFLALFPELRKHAKVVLAANQHLEVRDWMQDHQLDRQIDGAIFDFELGVAKPDPDFFRKVLTHFNVQAENALYIGDRIDNDVIPALLTGWDVIRLLPEGEYRCQTSEVFCIPPFTQADTARECADLCLAWATR